ncbi:unnamed protein product, partial [Rotaria magnacalcarata]
MIICSDDSRLESTSLLSKIICSHDYRLQINFNSIHGQLVLKILRYEVISILLTVNYVQWICRRFSVMIENVESVWVGLIDLISEVSYMSPNSSSSLFIIILEHQQRLSELTQKVISGSMAKLEWADRIQEATNAM